jgi:hypothetical protein
MHHVGLLCTQHAAQIEHGLGVGARHSVATLAIVEDPGQPINRAPQLVDPQRPAGAVAVDAWLDQRRERDIVAARDELAAQVLDDTFLATDDWRERLGKHQDSHRHRHPRVAWRRMIGLAMLLSAV